MKLFHDLNELANSITSGEKLVITIGAFDGVHVAHRALIAGAVMRAHELNVKSAVISFDPHPDSVVRPDRPMIYLTTLQDKAQLISEIGTDYLVIQPFTQDFRSLSPEDFVKWLTSATDVSEIHIGEDFVFGHKARGNVALLCEMGHQQGFHVKSLAALEVSNHIVSSTSIREALMAGKVEYAARLLGRYHSVQGPVVMGHQRGRLLGFHTANLQVDPDFAVPGNGVYVTMTTDLTAGDGVERPSVTNIGVRPTFDNGARSVETFILDFEGDLYDRILRVEFIAKLRDERKFSGIEELVAQLSRDVAGARAILTAKGQA